MNRVPLMNGVQHAIKIHPSMIFFRSRGLYMSTQEIYSYDLKAWHDRNLNKLW